MKVFYDGPDRGRIAMSFPEGFESCGYTTSSSANEEEKLDIINQFRAIQANEVGPDPAMIAVLERLERKVKDSTIGEVTFREFLSGDV